MSSAVFGIKFYREIYGFVVPNFHDFLIKRIYAFHIAGKNASLKIGGEPLQRLGDSRLKN